MVDTVVDTVADRVDTLTAKTPCGDLLPRTIGAVTIAEHTAGHVTAILPMPGATPATIHGHETPKPGHSVGRDGDRLLWFGHDQYLLIGPVPVPGPDHGPSEAAQVDQSDAWAMVTLSGADAVAILARLTPLDLRAAVFEPGHTARTDIGHMAGSLTRLSDDSFLILVFRSMAATLIEELTHAAQSVTARAAG